MAVAERPTTEAVYARWNELYTEYYQLAFGVARQRVRNQADAEDAVQQTFVGVYELLATGEPVASWGAMIATIAKRAASKERRRGERAESLPLDAQVDQVAERDTAERREALEAVFRSLTEAEQQAVYFTLVEGRSASEVAKRLGTSAESARHLLSRGRAALVLSMVTANLAVAQCPDDREVSDICRYLANRMSSEERREFVEHRKSCSRCQATVERVREFRGFVLLLLPAGLVGVYGEHLYTQIQTQQVASKTRVQRRVDPRLLAGALVVLLLIGGGTMVVTHRPNPAVPVTVAASCPTGKLGGFAYLDNGNVVYRSSPSAAPQTIDGSGRADDLLWTPNGTTLIYKDARRKGPVGGTLYAVHAGSAPFWSFGTAVDMFAISPDSKSVVAFTEHDDSGGNWTSWTMDIVTLGSSPATVLVEREVVNPGPQQWFDTAEPYVDNAYFPGSADYAGVFWFGHSIYVAEGVQAGQHSQAVTFDAAGNQIADWSAPTAALTADVAALAQPPKSALHLAGSDQAVQATCGSVTKPLVAPPLFSRDSSGIGALIGDPKNPNAAIGEVYSATTGYDLYLVTADGKVTALTTDHLADLALWQP